MSYAKGFRFDAGIYLCFVIEFHDLWNNYLANNPLMQKFLVFIIGNGLAYLLIRYRRQIRDFIGEIPFAETYIGGGGTATMIALIGILTFILTIMYVFGTLDGLLQSTIGRIT